MFLDEPVERMQEIVGEADRDFVILINAGRYTHRAHILSVSQHTLYSLPQAHSSTGRGCDGLLQWVNNG
jgi:hypothetical protein